MLLQNCLLFAVFFGYFDSVKSESFCETYGETWNKFEENVTLQMRGTQCPEQLRTDYRFFYLPFIFANDVDTAFVNEKQHYKISLKRSSWVDFNFKEVRFYYYLADPVKPQFFAPDSITEKHNRIEANFLVTFDRLLVNVELFGILVANGQHFYDLVPFQKRISTVNLHVLTSHFSEPSTLYLNLLKESNFNTSDQTTVYIRSKYPRMYQLEKYKPGFEEIYRTADTFWSNDIPTLLHFSISNSDQYSITIDVKVTVRNRYGIASKRFQLSNLGGYHKPPIPYYV